MTRVLKPELLDTLPASDPEAKCSRADLRRVNFWMGHRGILSRALASLAPAKIRHIIELGAGDGTLALTLANRLCDRWPDVELTLVDRQPVVAKDTLRDFQSLGWKPKIAAFDVFDWLDAIREPADVVVTNLFLHHFEAADLRRLLLAVAAGCRCFVALEPRRSAVALLGSLSLGLIGCNRVTRHDARVSVHAGFRGQELSQLWPASSNWTLREQPAGLFSHLFVATRIAR